MKKSWILFFILLISYLQASEARAQTKTTQKKKIEPSEKPSEPQDTPEKQKKVKKNPQTIQVFEEVDDYTAPNIAVARKIEAYNVVKFNPWGVLLGMYSGSYERIITPTLSGELTFGMTKLHSRTGLFTDELWGGAKQAFFQKANIQSLETGLVWGLTARYYVGKRTHIPEGAYLMGGFQTRTYRFTENDFVSPEIRGSTAVPSALSETDLIRFMFGYQSLGTLGSSFCWDWYIGGAYRKLTSDGPYSTSTQFSKGQRTLSTDPVFLVGCKVGMAF